MAGTGGLRAGDSGDRAIAPIADFAEYVSARERFFAQLRRDSELRRLEKLWALSEGPEAHGDAPPGPGGV